MKSELNIRLRLIQQDSGIDKENYLALQKSVAILKNWEWDNEEKLNEWSWQNAFKNKNRICYVIEKVPENVYCGECAVKDITDEIPEIEIELMKECQGQGIGYLAVIDMLNKLSDFGKENYYARVEPDNYASCFLFEKLGGRPAGLSRDWSVPDERVQQFTERGIYLLDQDLEETAKKFGVEAKILLTHVLVYRINIKDISENRNKLKGSNKHRERIDLPRRLTREKYKEMIRGFLEELQQIEKEGTTAEKLSVIINEKKNKRMDYADKRNESIKLSYEL